MQTRFLLAAITALAVSLLGCDQRLRLSTAKKARIEAEREQLRKAVEEYKNINSDYPPDLSDPVLVKRHLRRVFPRYVGDVVPEGDPASALVYWLAGPEGKGFSQNPRDPFDSSSSRQPPLFEFDQDRIKNGRYYPPGMDQPYVYFDHRTYDRAGQNGILPRKASSGEGYDRPQSFQLVVPGLDDSSL